MSLASVVEQGRRLLVSSLLDSGTVYDRTVASDGVGGKIETWTLRTGTLACRLVSPKETPAVSAAGVLQSPVMFTLLSAVGTDLAEGDRVVVAGRTFSVVGSLVTNSVLATSSRHLIRELP